MSKVTKHINQDVSGPCFKLTLTQTAVHVVPYEHKGSQTIGRYIDNQVVDALQSGGEIEKIELDLSDVWPEIQNDAQRGHHE